MILTRSTPLGGSFSIFLITETISLLPALKTLSLSPEWVRWRKIQKLLGYGIISEKKIKILNVQGPRLGSRNNFLMISRCSMISILYGSVGARRMSSKFNWTLVKIDSPNPSPRKMGCKKCVKTTKTLLNASSFAEKG
jgi:hypothetical protein